MGKVTKKAGTPLSGIPAFMIPPPWGRVREGWLSRLDQFNGFRVVIGNHFYKIETNRE